MTTTCTFCHVVAASQNNVIGLNNQLPWHIPEDLKFFHDITRGKVCIMGRKTFESLGKPLDARLNLVLTRRQDFKAEGCLVFKTLKEAMDHACTENIVSKYGKEPCIIGGGDIYKQSLPLVDKLYITRIYKEYEGDAFYPEIPKDQFKEIEKKARNQQGLAYSFLVYERL